MTKIFKNLSRHWVTCLAIFALLIVQASCDLSLPGMTSNIVNVGIQQSGVESPVPSPVRADTLQALEWLMTQEQAGLVEAAYAPADENGLRRLTDGADRDALAAYFTTPDMALYMIAAQNAGGGAAAEAELDAAVQTVCALPVMAAAQAGTELPPEQVRALVQEKLSAALDAIDETTKETLAGQAVLLVGLEYAAQGIADQVQMDYLLREGGRMLGLTLLLALCAISVGFLAARTSAAIGRDLRQSVFKKVVSFSRAELDQFSTASLITRTTNDIQQVQMTCVILLRMVLYAPILGVGGVWRVAHTGTSLSWIIALTVALLLALVFVLVKVAMPKFKMMQKLVDRLNLVSREILTGVMPIRAFSREKFEEERFDRANKDLMETQLFTNRVMAGMMPFMTIIMNGASLLIIWFGGKAMDTQGMQVGDLIAFITYTMQIVMSFLMLAMVCIMLPRAGVAADRIDEVLTTEVTIRDPEPEAAREAAARSEWRGEVAFHDVCMRYPGADADALYGITFTARPGQTTAIIGSTGCGKSTLLNLIPRFFDVTEGSITVDGIDIRQMPQRQLRALLGYVPQKGVLFSGTIDSNLKFGGEDITDAQVRKAARIAQAAEFIEAKPEGYASPIAQGGSNVSGGQKQRLSIARAIAKDPKIYLFDDSFSALDYKTDVALRRALNHETKDATVIIVAQRISTVLHADQIVVLDEGRIVGIGRHAELLRDCPEYQEIARSQLSQKELDQGGEQ